MAYNGGYLLMIFIIYKLTFLLLNLKHDSIKVTLELNMNVFNLKFN